MKYFEKSDAKFISAAKSASKRSEMIKALSKNRVLSMIMIVCFGMPSLVNMLLREPPSVWFCFMLLFAMIVGINADQQIKVLKCLAADDGAKEA